MKIKPRARLFQLIQWLRNKALAWRERYFRIPIMEIDLNGSQLTIDGFKPIDSRLDRAYRTFYQSFFTNPTFSHVMNESLPPLEREIERYLDHDPSQSVVHEDVINNLTPVWRAFIDSRQYVEAQTFWQRIHRTIDAWQRGRGSRFHMGGLLYYWGSTALMQGELDKGFFLMHSAYEQDVRTMGSDRPNTPAYKFVTMDFEAQDQLFQPYVQIPADHFNRYFKEYRMARLNHFTIEDFRRQFLETVSDPAIAFAFAHAVARLEQIGRFSPYMVQSTFASQYQLGLLFELVLVSEAAIKLKDPNNAHRYFPEFAGFLASQSGLQIRQSDLQQDINPNAKADFAKVLAALLFETYTLSSGHRLSRLECDIGLAYAIRNLAAHDVTSSPLIWGQFKGIVQATMNVLILTAEVLYP